MSGLNDVKRKWLADLADLVGGGPAAEPPKKGDPQALQRLVGHGGAASAQAAPGSGPGAPGGPFAPSPSDLILNPYGPDSIFSLPTPPMTPAVPAAQVKVSANTPLDTAMAAWTQTHSRMTTQLGQLKSAILTAFIGEAPALVTDLQKKVTRLDGLAKVLDTSLADALNKGKAAGDAAGRRKALQAAGAVVGKFRNHLKAQDKFLTQIDANPFGVKTNLKQDLSASLDQVSKAIH